MHRNFLSRVAIFVVSGAGCVTSLLLTFQLAFQLEAIAAPPAQDTTLQRQPQAQMETSLPVRLKIPSINLDAAIEAVGLTSKGAMNVPKDPDNVGWYSLGTSPGEKGNAVLDGHLDWYNGKTAVFQHLDKVRTGDILYVETDKGRLIPFIVREIRTFQQSEYASALFQKSDGRHLNLVTCSGAWDTFRKIYSERLVVFSDAVVLN